MTPLDAFAEFLRRKEIDEIRFLGEALQGRLVQHINSTLTGGGVAEILSRLVPMMNEVGLRAQWTVMEAQGEFFEVTKALHNALHGQPVPLTAAMKRLFFVEAQKNSDRVNGDADFVILHDPQPLPLIRDRSAHKGRWIWRCHIDLSDARRGAWNFLRPLVEKADGALFHMPEYAKDLSIPQYIVPPAIDPFSEKNREMSGAEVEKRLAALGVSMAKPIILQVSRFDRLKDPLGVIRAYEIVKRSFDCQLVLAGGSAADDPEGERYHREVCEKAEVVPGVVVLNLPPNSDAEINALQRAATVVVQKSLREGFGLTVTEAMWKAKPVVGGAVGGIRRQIIEGATGFLVESPEGAAFRIRLLLAHPELRQKMGEMGRAFVRQNFLMVHYLKHWLLVLLGISLGKEGVIRLDGPAGKRQRHLIKA